MDIKTAKTILNYMLKSDIAPNLIGKPGIGKTSIIKQNCEENGDKLRIINLGNQDVGDIIGLADFTLDDSGNKIATKFMMPTWALEIKQFADSNPDKYGIIFLDEINRASRRDVIQAIFPLILEKRLHTTQFPSNVRIIAAMNPEADNDFTTELGEALLSRFAHIKVTSSVQSFVEYGQKADLDFEVLSFVQDQPELFTAKSEFNIPERTPDGRAWEMVSKLYKTGVEKHLFQEICYGIVGQPATIAFMKHLNHGDKPLSASDVLNVFNKEMKNKIKKYSEDIDNRRLDMLKYTNDAIVNAVEIDKVFTKKQLDNLVSFLSIIPKDMGYDLLRRVGLKNNEYFTALGNYPEIVELGKKMQDIRKN